MIYWIIQISIISIIFIFLVHNLLLFFKSTLTVPKIKDFINSPTQKYQNIYDTILDDNNQQSSDYTDIDILPNNNFVSSETESMKDELKTFLKDKLNAKDSDNSVPIGFSQF